MRKSPVFKLVLCAALAAMYVVLAYFSVGTNDFKVAFGSIAILMAALLMGPTAGFAVGAMGEFINQLLKYGIDPTTPMWLIPYACAGLVVGIIIHFCKYKPSNFVLFLSIALHEIIITALVTPVNYFAAVIQGWGNWPMIAAAIPLRVAIMGVRVLIYFIVVPVLYKAIKKVNP